MKNFFVCLVLVSILCGVFTYSSASAQVSESQDICTQQGVGTDGDLYGKVSGFIGMLGKPYCFEFLRWRYLDAFVDVPKYQTVLAINVVKVLVPGSPDWSNSTRLARCRAFYPDGFVFLRQDGFVRYYTSPDGPFTTELGVDSCFIRAIIAEP
jgi:hypothetical protein